MSDSRIDPARARTPRRPHYAVIGTGAAALGVLDALLRGPSDAAITLVDIGRPARSSPDLGEGEETTELAAVYAGLYRDLFSLHRRQFPPPKTHFGEPIPRYRLKNGDSLFKSDTFGGLTNFWGSTMLPFTDAEMRGWPFAADRLKPHFARLAARVGLSGGDDGLLGYFGRDFATRPPIRPLAALQRLSDSVNSRGAAAFGGFRVVSGVNRCAVETRAESPRACVYCGECMAGCVKGAVFSAADAVAAMLREKRIHELVQGRVVAIDLSHRTLTVDTPSGRERLTGFSKIFLCAGCAGSTEILMRSTGLTSGPVMKDNSVYVFPIVNVGSGAGTDTSRYIGLCNLILGCVPSGGADRFAQVQVYPNFDYMWRYNMPPRLWPVLAPLVRASRPRLFWGRLYLHSDLSRSYAMRLEDDRVVFEDAPPPDAAPSVKRLMRAVRKAVNGSGFFVPPVPPIRQRTNSHYAGTLPFGGLLLEVPSSAEVGRGVYLCDSAAFPDTPAVSLTFSIMANASRIAWEATNG